MVGDAPGRVDRDQPPPCPGRARRRRARSGRALRGGAAARTSIAGRFWRGRLLLAHGRWLRRRRRVTDSRAPLREARDTFDAIGAPGWGDQARRELRASGERSRRHVPEARDELTAQELQIAQLAAEGLSNREIGQRLFLSHRTISTHLYRVFPKLGITSRAELSARAGVGRRDALVVRRAAVTYVRDAPNASVSRDARFGAGAPRQSRMTNVDLIPRPT